VAVAAVLAAQRDAQAIVFVVAADHVVRKPEQFREACRKAAAAARDGMIVTFGIRPTRPATNYGYIRPGRSLNGGAAFAVDAFVEKPDAATAAGYVAENYLWNSGNFLFRADVMLDEIARFDIVVIATTDAVLVVARDKAEDVKTLVERLKTQNRREAIEHRRIYRPWGYYQSIDAGGRYQVKRIMVKPGAKLSLQKHFHRAEHWVVVKGTAEVTVDAELRAIHENESIYVPIGSTHRLANPGKIPLELIEVQVGSYLGEDDIVRLDDVYDRI
jgi:mannose-6-phosphate isomerase-like protein (cupin superfamily)